MSATMKEDFPNSCSLSRSFMDLAESLSREELLEILSGGLCGRCEGVLQSRIENLKQSKGKKNSSETSKWADNGKTDSAEFFSVNSSDMPSSSSSGLKLDPSGRSNTIEPKYLNRAKKKPASSSSSQLDNGKTKSEDLFWGDSSDHAANDGKVDHPSSPPSGNSHRAEPSHLNQFMRADSDSSPASVNSKHKPASNPNIDISLNDGLSSRKESGSDNGLSEEQKEHIRFAQVKRKKDFVHYERVEGRKVNVLQGLELHSQVFNAEEQLKIVESVYKLQRLGQQGQLRERTYTEPRKWMRGKGRATIQFGCCYNYAVDKKGNPPGILREEEVDPLPPMFKKMIERMVRFHVLPPTCVPNSCIVNIYDEGDCIPPHIDHHDFVRPFCTVSFLSECNILFGSNLKIVSPGEFSGPVSIPLPVGSVLILQGNGADVAKHCVPAVPSKRISVTFRKMDESKIPYSYRPDPELSKVVPLVHRTPSILGPSPTSQQINGRSATAGPSVTSQEFNGGRVKVGPMLTNLTSDEEYPPLGSSSSSKKRMNGRSVH